MQQPYQWLQRVAGVNEDTPYHSSLASETDCPGGVLNLGGLTVFRVEDGILTFRFFVDGNSPYTAPHEALKASRLVLHIPARDFHYPAMVTGISGDATALTGFLPNETFGDNDAPLSGLTIWFIGIPERWYGTDNWVHYQVISTEQTQVREDDSLVIPGGRSSASGLSGFTLEAAGWTARLREIPNSRRADPSITHVCDLTNKNAPLTGALARSFLDDNLFPFLDFVFGQNTRFHTIVGYKDGTDLWAMISPDTRMPLKTRRDNWYLRTWYDPVELSPLFQRFYDLAPDVKAHWKKVIYQYVTSEEIMGTLLESRLAASVSFAALDGLTRSVISTYPCKGAWLKDDLRLKSGKGIRAAITMVAKQEFGPHSETFREASEQISRVRNSTFHTDLSSDEDPTNAFYRWNASQALVEILLLKQMGLNRIPNRTAHGKFNVLGKDMYQEMRKEELDFGQRDDGNSHGKLNHD